MKTDLLQSCGHCWVFQICWHIECSTFTSSSFKIWNSSTGILSPPLALFIVMLSKAHLTSHSRMSGSRSLITPSWLSCSWRYFLYSSSVYSCHLSYQLGSFPFSAEWYSIVCTMVYLSIHLLRDILVTSKLWQLWIKLHKHPYAGFCVNLFSSPSGKYQGARFLDSIRVCLVLGNPQTDFESSFIILHSYQQNISSYWFTSLLAFSVVNVPLLAILIGV